MIFKYHPDGNIYRDHQNVGTATDFLAANPDFPMAADRFFEYKKNQTFELITLSEDGTWLGNKVEDLEPYQDLIDAINLLPSI